MNIRKDTEEDIAAPISRKLTFAAAVKYRGVNEE